MSNHKQSLNRATSEMSAHSDATVVDIFMEEKPAEPAESIQPNHLESNGGDSTIDKSPHPSADPSDVSSSYTSRLFSDISRRLIDEFTPAFFVAIMGTGVCSNILYNFPYPSEWLRVCGWIMFIIATLFMVVTTSLFVVQVCKKPGKLMSYHTDPTLAPFMGCWPMGLTTIINFLGSLVDEKPHGAVIMWVLWWIVVASSLYCCGVIWYWTYIARTPHKSKTKPGYGARRIKPDELHSTLLLPIVTLTVAASSGQLLVLKLPPNLQMPTLVISFVLWSNAIVLSFIITTIYFWKLVIFKIPPTNLVFTSFLPIGFLGQGAYGNLLFGNNMYHLIVNTEPSSHYFNYVDLAHMDPELVKAAVANTVVIVSALVSLMLISFGYYMTCLATVSCLSKCAPFTSNHNPGFTHPKYGYIFFTKSFWAMTFPLGTMSLSNTEFYRIFGEGMAFFRVMGTIYAVVLLIITIGCLFAVVMSIMHTLFGARHTKLESKV